MTKKLKGNIEELENIVTSLFESEKFDLEHETNMVQSRILSPILEVFENTDMTQGELAEKTGMSQPMINGIFNLRKKLTMRHIALLQKALNIVIQPPKVWSTDDHKRKFYSRDSFEGYELVLDALSKTVVLGHPYIESRKGNTDNESPDIFFYYHQSDVHHVRGGIRRHSEKRELSELAYCRAKFAEIK